MGDKSPLQKFGSKHTRQKLDILDRYVTPFLRIIHGPRSKGVLKAIYIDAFAGTGLVDLIDDTSEQQETLFDFENEPSKIDGSARLVLKNKLEFDEYVLIEKSTSKVAELKKLKDEFSERSHKIRIINGDANVEIQRWVSNCNKFDRALVFLDPFGMQVTWETMKSLSRAPGADVWILFPISAVNRLLMRTGCLPQKWEDRLDQFFGETGWRDAFYETHESLIEGTTNYVKQADFGKISAYFSNKLRSIFISTIQSPMILYTTNGHPLFLLSFAATNTAGAATAARIATHLVRR